MQRKSGRKHNHAQSLGRILALRGAPCILPVQKRCYSDCVFDIIFTNKYQYKKGIYFTKFTR